MRCLEICDIWARQVFNVHFAAKEMGYRDKTKSVPLERTMP